MNGRQIRRQLWRGNSLFWTKSGRVFELVEIRKPPEPGLWGGLLRSDEGWWTAATLAASAPERPVTKAERKDIGL